MIQIQMIQMSIIFSLAGVTMKICPVCGKEIIGNSSRSRKYHVECAAIAKKQQMREARKRMREKSCNPSVYNCLHCTRPKCQCSLSVVTVEESAAVRDVLSPPDSEINTVDELIMAHQIVYHSK